MKIRLVISYDGTNYCGWQSQENGTSVQQLVERAVLDATGEKVAVVSSGRTDAGVHAAGQVAHFETKCPIPPEKIKFALNALLPDDVKIVKSERAADDFHARYSAKKKTYRYSFYVSDVILPLKDRFAERIVSEPDYPKMLFAADALCGEHDFVAFSSVGSSVRSTVRTIYSISVTKTDGGFYFDVCGNGFLYNMVRVIAGTLIAVGYGEISAADIKAALESGKRDRRFKTLPAKGLTLLSVEYGN